MKGKRIFAYKEMKTTCKIIAATVFLIAFVATDSFGAPLPPSGQTPLDPVSWVLLGAAGAFAGKKYYDSRKEKND